MSKFLDTLRDYIDHRMVIECEVIIKDGMMGVPVYNKELVFEDDSTIPLIGRMFFNDYSRRRAFKARVNELPDMAAKETLDQLVIYGNIDTLFSCLSYDDLPFIVDDETDSERLNSMVHYLMMADAVGSKLRED